MSKYGWQVRVSKRRTFVDVLLPVDVLDCDAARGTSYRLPTSQQNSQDSTNGVTGFRRGVQLGSGVAI